MLKIRTLWSDNSAAVAPTIALSLFGLVAAGGLAFDYARVAAMDTELQSAADQAALAAATQLDRYEDSQTRATAAITASDNTNRLAANFTRFANDEEDATVEVTLTFCEDFDDDVADTTAACDVTAEGEDTRFVVVTTETRIANYALTPIVAAFASAPIQAVAVAGVESSICNVAPLLVCTEDNNFPGTADIGKGMIMKPGSQNSWAPGNYGLLDFGSGNNAVIDALLGHGLNGCQADDDGSTEPGNKNVTDAINTRLDVYAGNPATRDPAICATDGTGCPALSARKDMVARLADAILETTTATQPTQAQAETAAAARTCPADPAVAGEEYEAPSQPVVGLDRDICHYTSCADGNFGDGEWNRTAYFNQYHGGDATAALAFVDKTDIDTLTRYDVYRWELDDPTARMGVKRSVSIKLPSKKKGSRWEWTVQTQCNYAQPFFGDTSYDEQKDRRVLPVVAANCDGLNGKGEPGVDYTLLRAFDVFITEPSLTRLSPTPTDNKEIYAEIIGPAQTFEGGSGFQYYSKSKPYLVR